MNQINQMKIKVVKRLLILQAEELAEIRELITEVITSGLSWEEFSKSVKAPIPLKGKKTSEEIILKHQNLLRILTDTGIFSDFSRFMYYEGNQKLLLKFLSYLETLKSKKFEVLKLLRALEDLGISTFQYVSERGLNITYTEFVRKHSYINGESYDVEGVWTDGKKEWNARMINDENSFNLRGANYIIKYSKGVREESTEMFESIEMSVCNLEFSKESLPTEDVLYNTSVCPFVDEEEVRRQTIAATQARELEKIRRMTRQVLEDTKKFVQTIDGGEKVLNYMSDFEKLISALDQLKVEMKKRQQEEGINTRKTFMEADFEEEKRDPKESYEKKIGII